MATIGLNGWRLAGHACKDTRNCPSVCAWPRLSANFVAGMSADLILAGRYRLIAKLGSGGMGSVWRAHDQTLNAEVAVKLLEPEFVASSEATARFRREAQAAAAIRSTHVVQILDHGVDGGKPFIAMELLNGESLEQRLTRVGHLGPELTARILGQVARAIALAHDHGIVHRDLKPDNIFLVREYDDEIAKVLDFGIARQRGGLADTGGVQTKTGAVLGTPYYMSPEQATGQAVNHLSDIWSFGVIACECLTAKRVFDAETLGGLFHAICIAPMPVPSQSGQVPAGFDAWFACAAARDPSARFQNIKAAAAALQTLCGYSGRPSLDPGVSDNRNSAQASRPVAPKAELPAAPALQMTAAPSSRSIAGLTKPTRRTNVGFAFAAVAMLIVGLYLGWHWIRGSEAARTAASAAASITTHSVPALTKPAHSAVAPESAPNAISAPAPTVSAPESTAPTQATPMVIAPAIHQDATRALTQNGPKRTLTAQPPNANAANQSVSSKPRPAAPAPPLNNSAKNAPAAAPKPVDRLGI